MNIALTQVSSASNLEEENHVICIYTDDFTDEEDVFKVEKEL